MRFRGDRDAVGAPGEPTTWTPGDKDGVGTAYSADSRVWFTLWRGALTEVYFPQVDHPQLRLFEFAVTDGESFVHTESRDLRPRVERLSPLGLGYRATSEDPEGRYSLVKEIVANPHLPCVVLRVRLLRHTEDARRLGLYALAEPHLALRGWGNSARVVVLPDGEILAAERANTWLALGAHPGFARVSCGYVGRSDGRTDLLQHRHLRWEFDRALNGHVGLVGQLDLERASEFTVGLAFGRGLPNAVSSLLQTLGAPFEEHKRRFLDQWQRPARHLRPLDRAAADGGHLYRGSYSLLLAHEDKTFPGAFIASLSIPWGETKGDQDRGAYHFVWTRDLVQIATGLLAAGNTESALRVLIYLAASQQPDGSFPQNFWLNGEPFWRGVQLDEVAFPILLAWRLGRENGLKTFDPYPMVALAARFLVDHGPATGQERWEELSGYSPSTLAVNIAALVCAGQMARERGEEATARFLEEYADFLEAHLEPWTVTTEGSLVPDIPRHYIRLHPVDISDPTPDEDPNRGVLVLPNQSPEGTERHPASRVVDAGFLELVRYGVRRPEDPVIQNSLRVVDAVLRVDTPYGPCWRRYNGDGYGQRDDGSAYRRWGTGRAWPLLTGERGHYELARGADAAPYAESMERLATSTGLLPEQIWDEPDRPDRALFFGRPTGAAVPLLWAHAEYLKLLRSLDDRRVFDFIPEVAQRYRVPRGPRAGPDEIWKRTRQPGHVAPGAKLRIQVGEPFRLHWSDDGWRTVHDSDSTTTGIRIDYADLAMPDRPDASLVFTFYWKRRGSWEGRDYTVHGTTSRESADAHSAEAPLPASTSAPRR